MGIEIERKFRVRSGGWQDFVTESIPIKQGYLQSLRVRLAGQTGLITIKGPAQGLRRQEFEYEIPVEDAHELMAMSVTPVLEKTRHLVPFGGKLWEVDVFHGPLAGLVLAEVELEQESEQIELPEWVGEELSEDIAYYNTHLAQVLRLIDLKTMTPEQVAATLTNAGVVLRP